MGIHGVDIPGINAKEGLALYDDDSNIYRYVLRAYVPNAVSVIEKLSNVSKETLADYAVNVHGLKGISAGIGAEKLRNAAQEMEGLARSGDLAGILAGNDAFLSGAKELAANVKAYLDGWESE